MVVKVNSNNFPPENKIVEPNLKTFSPGKVGLNICFKSSILNDTFFSMCLYTLSLLFPVLKRSDRMQYAEEFLFKGVSTNPSRPKKLVRKNNIYDLSHKEGP